MKTTLKGAALAAVLLAAAACSPTQHSPHASWGDLMSSRTVAKVSNIKSLEQPGMY